MKKYKQWNDAFVKHFFKDNQDKEIILYLDKEIIEQIGTENCLGGIDDFLSSILINVEERRLIYQNNIGTIPNGNIEFNRQIQSGSIFEFALFLSKKTPITKLPFLNYVLLAIYAKTNLDETDRSYYSNLNSLINSFDNTQKKISSNNIKLDDLFNKIELFDTRFKNELIGNLAFMGLLKYQVVLSPKEKYEFEETIFKFKIGISEDTSYHQFANRFLSVVPSRYSNLKDKIKIGGKEPVYAKWFLNKVFSFNPEKFSELYSNIKHERELGEIAIVFNPIGEKYLYLTINTQSTNDIVIGDYIFHLENKREDGFSLSPILLNNKKEVAFKTYENIKNENFKFSFLQIKKVNFLQKNSNNHYQQVLNPIANTDTYIIVENKPSEIEKWEKWKDKNTINCDKRINPGSTKELFSDKYILYFSTSINKEYYTRNINVDPIDYSKDLYVKKIGGYKLRGKDTYFDVALPSFQIQNPIQSEEDIKVSVKTNGSKDIDIEYHFLPKNIIKFFLSKDKVILNEQNITITFKLKKLIKEFSFIVIPSEICLPTLDSLFKLNKWGAITNSPEIWYNGNKMRGCEKIKIGNGRHALEGLDVDNEGFNNYFIYLLAALSNKRNSSKFSYSDIIGLIDLSKTFYDINNKSYSIDSYSNRNIIRNLIALEYLNKKKNELNENIFQIVPPSLLKLERSFNSGGNQIYKLSGVRSRRLEQVIKEFCSENEVTVKYLDFEDSSVQPLEHLILPSLVFIDTTINIIDLNAFIFKELGINLLLQHLHHIGDSLLNYIESINSFKGNFLNKPARNLENQRFNEGNNLTLPRIIESANESSKRGQLYSKKYLRISNDNTKGIFGTDKILINWAKLYVAHEQQKVVLFLKKPIKSYGRYTFYPKILIPKSVELPSIIYKALTSINNGIPDILKSFIMYADERLEMQNKRFVYFDNYHINIDVKSSRRENISRILTGNIDVINNKQVVFYSEYESKASMHFACCSTFSSVSEVIMFKDLNNNIIALCDNYKNIYIKSDNGKAITIDNQIIKVEKLSKVDTTLNKIFSQIISNEYHELKTDLIKESEFFVETITEEEIKILNLHSYAY